MSQTPPRQRQGGAAVECCSITSFFGEDGQVSIPLLCFLLLRSQEEVEGWASVAGMIYECTGRLLDRAPSAADMNSGEGTAPWSILPGS